MYLFFSYVLHVSLTLLFEKMMQPITFLYVFSYLLVFFTIILQNKFAFRAESIVPRLFRNSNNSAILRSLSLRITPPFISELNSLFF